MRFCRQVQCHIGPISAVSWSNHVYAATAIVYELHCCVTGRPMLPLLLREARKRGKAPDPVDRPAHAFECARCGAAGVYTKPLYRRTEAPAGATCKACYFASQHY